MARQHCLILGLMTLALFATCLSSGAPATNKDQSGASGTSVLRNDNGEELSIDENAFATENEDDLLAYEPIASPKHENSVIVVRKDAIKPSSRNLERDSGLVLPGSSKDNKAQRSKLAASTSDDEVAHLPNADRFSSIAHNSREVRLVGPDQKEVEMKDDVATKVVVALENLHKEAGEVWDQVNDKLDKGWKDLKRSEVWGQVNDKLDKGWTDIKGMVEGVVSPSSKRQP